ncbi:PIN domain-containing protein [Sphingomonas sp. MMSM20]|uniref:PIN domain-containing protein n=1 Tax=Sphingomonas lycopersici TaxID=2951807 RepID=UPI0022382A8B|nr:PIN domain-containing protein [Sphingomonas lycopersici]MCW6532571.1 PIN domain-containing protein [Sphingomonas lycopersici]
MSARALACGRTLWNLRCGRRGTRCSNTGKQHAAGAAVQAWLDEESAETLYLSSVTIAELQFGIGALPAGRRKEKLAAILEGLLALFDGRILPFDLSAARHYADLAVEARISDKGFPTPDGYIAAIAASRGFAVASRDTGAFRAAGMTVIDPWKVAPRS